MKPRDFTMIEGFLFISFSGISSKSTKAKVLPPANIFNGALSIVPKVQF